MATYGVSDVTIFNKALNRLGDFLNPVTAVDGSDTSKYGTLAGNEFQATRNAELRKHNWIFTIKRALLTITPTTFVNNTGFYFSYYVPADSLRVVKIYSLIPQYVYTYPFKYIHTSPVPFNEEQGIIYTDCDNANQNPYCEYVQEQPLGTTWYDMLFVDALTLRLAAKIAAPVLGDALTQTARDKILEEYAGAITEAKQNNVIEIEDDLPESGDAFWTDRARWG